jgi:1-acyl-sn-glycerol-3-phosphate acyltransferase
MSRHNIKKFSLAFQLVLFIGGLFHRAYYRRFSVIDRQKIPAGSPVIFAANHQNALMDALAVIFAARKQIVFMGRADIFKKQWMARLLYFIKILPVFRIRDGFFSVDQNKEVFMEIAGVLKNGMSAALFPEGYHVGEKRLKPLKKGAARLALITKDEIGPDKEVYIVPTGIDYSSYYHAGADLLVIFGDPIPVSMYHELYLADPVRAVNRLTDDLADAIGRVMINIRQDEHYSALHQAINLFAPVELKKRNLPSSLPNEFRIKKELSDTINKNIHNKEMQISSLKEELTAYLNLLKNHNIRDTQILNPIRNSAYFILKFLLSLLLLPIHLYGMAFNYLPYRLPVHLTRNIKDPHFISSFRFGIGLLMFFFWYLTLAIISFFIFNKILTAALFMIAVPLAGIFSFYYYIDFLKMKADYRWLMIRKKKREVYEEVLNRRNAIIFKIEELLD